LECATSVSHLLGEPYNGAACSHPVTQKWSTCRTYRVTVPTYFRYYKRAYSSRAPLIATLRERVCNRVFLSKRGLFGGTCLAPSSILREQVFKTLFPQGVPPINTATKTYSLEVAQQHRCCRSDFPPEKYLIPTVPKVVVVLPISEPPLGGGGIKGLRRMRSDITARYTGRSNNVVPGGRFTRLNSRRT